MTKLSCQGLRISPPPSVLHFWEQNLSLWISTHQHLIWIQAYSAQQSLPKTKAIIVVSLYGQCVEFDAVNAVALKHGLPVIEDGAQSFGTPYHGRKSCGQTTLGTTSFFPAKPLGCYGDGGAIFTDDDDLAAACRQLRNHGESRYNHVRVGLNGRLDTLKRRYC